jgi:hypothetical protein
VPIAAPFSASGEAADDGACRWRHADFERVPLLWHRAVRPIIADSIV